MTLSFSLIAQPVKRLYIANDDHTDYMWSANEVQYDSAFLHMLDYYLDEIDSTLDNPSNFQARFNCDGSYWLRVYEKHRSPVQFDRLISAIRSGHISIPLNTLANTYGAQPTEAVIRGMYYAGQIERRFGLRLHLAVAMENQTLPLGLSSLWAGSGAKYSWRGVCACASKMKNANWAYRKHQLYRYTGLDGMGVIMKWYNQTHNNASLGGYAETRLTYNPHNPVQNLAQTIDTLDNLCNTVTPNSNYPYQVAGAFGYGWDDLDTYVSPAFIQAAKKGTDALRKVRVSNEIDFFEDIEKSYPDLPIETISYGNEWDLYCASMNETTAKVRRATEKLRTAEALAAIVSLNDKTYGDHLAQVRNKAYDGYGLYWEHDWTADGPVPKNERAKWQMKMQEQISIYTDSLYDKALIGLGKQLKKSTNARFYVFNPLNWTRDDIVDLPFEAKHDTKVVNLETGKEVIFQPLSKEGKPFVRILAENIPSIGYNIFEIQKGENQNHPNAAIFSDGYFENDYYKIRFHPSGVISEIHDKQANHRQFVQRMDGRHLNDLGTSHLEKGDAIEIENAGPISVTLKAVSSDPIPHTVRLTLYKHIPRIEIQNSIQANFAGIKTWAFSFDLDEPTTHHEELGAILQVKKVSNGGHYADRNARYDWQTFNHFVDLNEKNFGITLSNLDCSFFKLGQSTPDSLCENSSQINALAGGQIDGETLGIPAQFGEIKFMYQFAIRSYYAQFNAPSALKFALEHQNPLVPGKITGDTGEKVDAFSLLSVSDPNVFLWSVKPSEEGIEKGLITRFWNTNSTSVNPNITLAAPIKKAWETTHIETNLKQIKPVKNSLKLNLNRHQIKTYRLLMN